ncbi:inovirus Gp2 family protein [Vibrio sp. 03-59-1]|uniref:inovirus Gp2 family protein n=1 Tax=Vibrio sp. 03-59-1 TaxID=2607607 RepID=UPI0014934EA7|nr:inovirus Gp2 family protein [Vibrio sp. 03-59-1]NOH84677.1 inovirus Gp2 family protein [Vibrio sp. 03-59-1]
MAKTNKSKNLTITKERTYNGYPLYYDKEGLVEEYLEKMEQVLDNALDEHPRSLAVRVDLNLPKDFNDDSSEVLTRFFRSLKSQIEADMKQKSKSGWCKYRDCSLRYVWAKECCTSTSSHYHVMLFLNRDVYNCLGLLEDGRSNLANRIRTAWKRSVTVSYKGAERAMVHFPTQGVYSVGAKKDTGQEVNNKVFYRMSYLAKLRTKNYGKSHKNFGTSRV